MDRPLHIGLVTDSGAFAGTERHILDLALGLREIGIETAVICPGASPLACKVRENRLPLIPMEARGPAAVGLLRWLLSTGKIDLLHAHNGRTALWATLAKTLSPRGRVIATQHFLHPAHTLRSGLRGAAARAGHRWVSASLDHVIAISNAVKLRALERGGLSSKKLTVVHNGIRDPGPLRPQREIRRALGVEGGPLIVCNARLELEKDVVTLIRALHRLPDPRPFCLIAGEGSERARLEAEIRCRNLGGRVRLVGFRDDALSLVNAADIFVLPSLAEPFGLAILEAMALRKPVIATRAGGPPEIVQDRSSGLLVPPGNERAMADAIQTLIAHPELGPAFGANGRARFLDRFTAARMAASTAAIYTRIANSNRFPL